MLEGVLKVHIQLLLLVYLKVSILGMLEGVLKGWAKSSCWAILGSFNPWYVGGGVKRIMGKKKQLPQGCFNPWYVGGGVKSLKMLRDIQRGERFNPWYVGGGVKSNYALLICHLQLPFQSLVCWRGC